MDESCFYAHNLSMIPTAPKLEKGYDHVFFSRGIRSYARIFWSPELAGLTCPPVDTRVFRQDGYGHRNSKSSTTGVELPMGWD